MKKALLTGVLSIALGVAQALAQPDLEGVVSIDRADRARAGSGFVTDDKGHVLTRVDAPGEVLFVTTTAGVTYNARQIDRDPDSGLSLLRLASGADALSPWPFARAAAEPERRVYAIRGGVSAADATLVSGSLANIQRSPQGRPEIYLHNALTGEAGLGLPLFNNCGEVVGVVVPRPGVCLFCGDDSDRVAYALPIDQVQSRFAGRGLAPARAAADCVSEAARAAEAEARARAEQARAQAEAEAAEARLQALERELEQNADADAAERARLEAEMAQRHAELARAEEERREAEEAQAAAEAERARLEAEMEQGRAELGRAEEARRGAEEAQAAAEEERREAEEARAAAEEEQRQAEEAQAAAEAEAKKREQQYLLWGAIAGGLLLLILILVWALKQRSVRREQAAKARAEAEAKAAAASAAAAEADLKAKAAEEARIAAVPTVFFDIIHASGARSALRVPGASIAAAKGAVVGRNPKDSDFVINHAEVSRRHFRLFTDGGLLLLEDLGATNGVIVDGKQLAAGQETVLADRSQARIGDLQLNVRLEQG